MMTAPKLAPGVFDLAVIGGGINGCGIARDAAGRGLSVLLVEKGDLASATSSASTKLIHGGLRYLEHYDFRLVRESLIEREILLRSAPHLIRPMRFILPHHDGLRPAWLIRLGLFLYDHLGGRELLPAARSLDLRRDPAGQPLQPRYTDAFEYSDCWVDDARLVVLTAVDAAQRGAVIRTGTELVMGERRSEHWQLHLRDHRTGRRETTMARMLVNAAGPWVTEILEKRLGQARHKPIRLVKGSHIIVRQVFDPAVIGPGRAYIFQNADGRIIFAIPYQREFTLLGTTDIDYRGDPGRPYITTEETGYLCAVANDYFTTSITPADVVASYSGVRPLYDDGVSAAQAATRDYVLDRDPAAGLAPLLTIYGGKITTFRRLAEHVMDQLADVFPQMGSAWTKDAFLPGGDFPVDGHADLVARIRAACPSCPPARAVRFAQSYGTRALALLDGLRDDADWGRRLGGDLTERELRYLMAEEWALSTDDVIWRRSKQGYHMTGAEIDALDQWFRQPSGTTRQSYHPST